MNKLLKTVKKKSDFKLVGGFLPPQVVGYLSLYVLAKGITKSEIIRFVLTEWVNNEKKRSKESELIRGIVERSRIQWKSIRNEKEMTFQEYKEELKKELLTKNISNMCVEQIINLL